MKTTEKRPVNIAIVGLGEVGGEFLNQVLKKKEQGFKVIYVAQLSDTPGKQRAEDEGIPVFTTGDIMSMGDAIDVVFDLTGNPDLRANMRKKMMEMNNRHTIIAPEIIARMMWSVLTDNVAFVGHDDIGY